MSSSASDDLRDDVVRKYGVAKIFTPQVRASLFARACCMQ